MKIGRREFGRLALLGAAAFTTSNWVAEPPQLNLDPKHHFFVIGDLHHREDEGYEQKTGAIISSLKILSGKTRGINVIFNGDMIHFPRGAKTCPDQVEQWERFIQLYLKLKEEGFVPHVVFGNHDGPRELAKSMLRGIVPHEELGNYVLGLGGGAKLITLSAIHPAKTELGFLERELEFDKGLRKIVISHYPPDQLALIPGLIYNGKGKGLWAKKGVLEAISEAEVPLISSHSHVEFAGEYSSEKLRRPIEFLGTPSVYRPLTYWGTKEHAKRILGITLVDSRSVSGSARFFDSWKPMWARVARVNSFNGKFSPQKLPRRMMRRA